MIAPTAEERAVYGPLFDIMDRCSMAFRFFERGQEMSGDVGDLLVIADDEGHGPEGFDLQYLWENVESFAVFSATPALRDFVPTLIDSHLNDRICAVIYTTDEKEAAWVNLVDHAAHGKLANVVSDTIVGRFGLPNS